MNELPSKGVGNCLLADGCAETCLEDRVETLWRQGRTSLLGEWAMAYLIHDRRVFGLDAADL